jgi:hypothetical protein
VARGVVIYDLINEPDNKKIFWQARFGRPSLASLYQRAMEAIIAVQPDALFALEVWCMRTAQPALLRHACRLFAPAFSLCAQVYMQANMCVVDVPDTCNC